MRGPEHTAVLTHDHEDEHLHRPAPSTISRRVFLGGIGLGALGVFLPGGGYATARSPSGLVLPEGLTAGLNPYRLAMHVHASFSEGDASMYASLSEAARTGHDVVYFTDHDWRKQALMARRAVHFTSLTENEDGIPWTWVPHTEGSPASAGGSIVTSPVSPNDPAAPGALEVRVTAQPGALAWNMYEANDTAGERKGVRLNVAGQQMLIDVRQVAQGPDAWLELRLRLSYYPSVGGKPAGVREVAYRFGARTGESVVGLLGIVWRQIPSDTWVPVVLNPLADVARLFPELPVPGDNSTSRISVGVHAQNGATARGYFDFLRLNRSIVGSAAYDEQDRQLGPYQGRFISQRSNAPVIARQNDEVGFQPEHLNWLTSHPSPMPYRDWAPDGNINKPPPAGWAAQVRQYIHDRQGIVQFNHPFGASIAAEGDQAALLNKAALYLLNGGINGVDLLEVAYRTRGGASLATHLALFDVMCRNGRFVTATGTTDDHAGLAGLWTTMKNRFATGIWSPTLSDADIQQTLLSGRAWCMEIGSWVGDLDMTVDTAPMGSVSVRPGVNQQTVQIFCPTPPSGGSVQLVRGVVDYAGTANPNPNVATIATVSAAELAGGPAQRTVNTATSCYVRLVVRNASSLVVGLSNPVWLLQSAPPRSIPLQRIPGTQPPPPPANVEPNSTVTAPAPGATLTSPITLAGTATDDRGVTNVYIAIREQTTKKLWLQPNGTWGTFQMYPATLTNPGATTTNWTYPLTLPPGPYGLSVRATDTNNTTETTQPWVLFTVTGTTNTEPNSTVTAPTPGATLTSPTVLAGTATDDRGVTNVHIAIREQTTKKLWLQPNGTWGTFQMYPATLTNPGATTTNWTYPLTLPPGPYGLSVRATDTNNTTETTQPWVIFTIA